MEYLTTQASRYLTAAHQRLARRGDGARSEDQLVEQRPVDRDRLRDADRSDGEETRR